MGDISSKRERSDWQVLYPLEEEEKGGSVSSDPKVLIGRKIGPEIPHVGKKSFPWRIYLLASLFLKGKDPLTSEVRKCNFFFLRMLPKEFKICSISGLAKEYFPVPKFKDENYASFAILIN